MIKKIDHVVITTVDFEKCAQFYKTLGFDVINTGGRYELFAGDFKINVHEKGRELFPHAANVKTGSADFCFEIEDIEEYISALKSKGIKIELGIVNRTGVRGSMRSFYIRDIDGNLLEFCTYEPSRENN